ncbi:MAG: hypothetical protein R3A48_05535 [Polyangiales bacterium]
MNIPGLMLAAIAVSVYATVIYGAHLASKAPREERALLALCFAAQLPMSALAFVALRAPLDALVQRVIAPTDALYPWVAMLYAPLTEEPAKLWPLLLPAVAKGLRRDNLGRVARALGVGFGVGEALWLAALLLKNPRLAPLPWHAFVPFMRERFQVALIHALLVAVTLYGVTARPRRTGLYLAGAMGAHLALNLPVLFAAKGWLGADREQALSIVTMWVALWWVAALLLLPRMEGAPPKADAAN